MTDCGDPVTCRAQTRRAARLVISSLAIHNSLFPR